MSEFLQRNKNKGALALLLLFMKRGKGAGPLLLLVILLGGIFIVPSGIVGRVPWAAKLADAIGLGRFVGAGGSGGGDLEYALNSERTKRSLALASAPSDYYGKSTVGLVKGDKSFLDDKGNMGKVNDTLAKSGGKSVGGILNPEDAQKNEGVSVDEDELRSGLMNNAFAGVMGGGKGLGGGAGLAAGQSLSGFDGVNNGGSSASLDKGRAADNVADMVKNTLDNTAVPSLGGRSIAGAAGGKLGWRQMSGLKTTQSRVFGTPTGGKSTVMYQLAEGRAYSIAAAPPPGNCPDPSCPKEYASHAGGAVFDGARPGGTILTASAIGETAVPVTPDATQTEALINEANQLEGDAKKCEEAERNYGHQERASMAKIQRFSDQLVNMGCNSGSCSRSKAERCRAVGDQMKAECNTYNGIAQQKANACPMMNGQSTQMNCNQ
ncbi:MAG TPA: hypothetical protein DCM05_03725 [Elusimicrobia bacterium]|nr:hypothetical protein [Elusimicrobiota bacterium]